MAKMETASDDEAEGISQHSESASVILTDADSGNPFLLRSDTPYSMAFVPALCVWPERGPFPRLRVLARRNHKAAAIIGLKW